MGPAVRVEVLQLGRRKSSKQKPATGADIRFRVSAAERRDAKRIAATLGMNLGDVMRVLLRHFVRERGLPVRREAQAEQGVDAHRVSAFGMTVGEMAREAGAALAKAKARAKVR